MDWQDLTLKEVLSAIGFALLTAAAFILLAPEANAAELARSDGGGIAVVLYDQDCPSNKALATARLIDSTRHTYYDGCYDTDQATRQILLEWQDGTRSALPAALFRMTAPQPVERRAAKPDIHL